MSTTAILIDDERKALEILKNKIERHCPEVEIVGQSQDPQKAIQLIEEVKPQIVFLDIAMPGMSGFDLLAAIPNPNFEVIFVTAFDNYAINAIEHCAIGYLVKPVDNKDLEKAVAKAIANVDNKNAIEKNKQLIQNQGVQDFKNRKIVIPCQEGLEFVKVDNILHCEGTEGYTKIHFEEMKPILSSYSIGHFSKLLEQHGFYLIHKSHLVNLGHIDKYLNEGYVVLSNGNSVPVSRNRRSNFLETLKNN